ncbi:hypothetical protein [Catenovulum sediminis]|uniref:Outer membrane protein beta-barrel domain-containing protein n=1 Tax=Catenovulum sediminis TaxID=1740262 RepID=A0ABV1RFC8_9ALTE
MKFVLKSLSLFLIAASPLCAQQLSTSVGVGYASTDLQAGHADIVKRDDSATSWQLGIHYQFDTVRVDFNYIDLGEGQVNLESATYTPDEYHQTVKSVSPILSSGYGLGVALPIVRDSKWRFNAQMGIFIWDNEIVSVHSQGGRITTSLHGTDGYVGSDFSYQVIERVSVGVEYRLYTLSELINSLTLQAKYHF